MFFFPVYAVVVMQASMMEHQRWLKLSPAQKEAELRLREVRALERQADALEKISRKS